MSDLNTIVAEIRPKVWAYSRFLPAHLREDATQEALITVWRNADTVLSANSPTNMALTIARTAVRGFDRARQTFGAPPRSIGSGRHEQALRTTVPAGDLIEFNLDFSEEPSDVDTRLDVADALAELSPEDATLVRTKFFEGYTWAETGKLLGLSLQGAFNRWDRHIRPALALALEGE